MVAPQFDEARIRADLAAAGFAGTDVIAVGKTSHAPSARHAAIGLCQGTPWRSEIQARDPDGLERATEHAARALERQFGTGPIEGRIRALVVTATP